MKNLILFLLLFPFLSIGQVSDKISFQAVVYDNQNKLVVNRNVGVRMSIVSGSVDGTTVYQETHLVTTSGTGLFTLQLGGGTPTIGTYSGINWGASSHFLKREFDINGGTNYQIMGIGEILSVPYAIHAKTVESISNNLPFEPDFLNIEPDYMNLAVGGVENYTVPDDKIFLLNTHYGCSGCKFFINGGLADWITIVPPKANISIVSGSLSFRFQLIPTSSFKGELISIKIKGDGSDKYIVPETKRLFILSGSCYSLFSQYDFLFGNYVGLNNSMNNRHALFPGEYLKGICPTISSITLIGVLMDYKN